MARLTLPFIILLSFVVTVFSEANKTTSTPSSTPPTPTTTSQASNPVKGVVSEMVAFATGIPKAIVSAFSVGFQAFENMLNGG